MNLQPDNLEEGQGNTHVIYLVYALSVEVNRIHVLFNLKFHRYTQFDNIYFPGFATPLGPSDKLLLPTSWMLVCFNNIFICSFKFSCIYAMYLSSISAPTSI